MVNQLIQDPNKLAKPSISVSLLEEFKVLGFERGERSLRKLEGINSELNKIFIRNPDISTSLVNTKRIKELTSDIYSQGIHLLETLLETVRQSGITNQIELQKEEEELEEELRRQVIKEGSLYSLIQERLGKIKKNLGLTKRNSDKVDEVLCHVGLCIDSLREICLEIPELISHRSKDDFDKVMLELNTRIEYAQRVKTEYDKQGI